MTSINALKIDRQLGIMMCDEQRHWNPERLKIYAADKIRVVVPPEITRKYRIAAAYGNTGTSSIGDELRLTIYREVEKLYRQQCEEYGHPPETFMTVEDIASLAYRVISDMKRHHIDGELKQKFGFNTLDFIRGETRDQHGCPVKIRDAAIIEKAQELISGKTEEMKTHAVFGNAGIVAGFDTQNGFTSYLFSMREHFWEPVYGGFVAQGSGSDSANFVLGSYFSEKPLIHQNAAGDRADALIRLILAVDKASQNNLGVGGYFNVLVFDGKSPEAEMIVRQINDHRSKLASETVRAYAANIIPEQVVREIVDGIFFLKKDAQWAETKLWAGAKNIQTLHRFLRGYPVN